MTLADEYDAACDALYTAIDAEMTARAASMKLSMRVEQLRTLMLAEGREWSMGRREL